jgi:hypothetical protein
VTQFAVEVLKEKFVRVVGCFGRGSALAAPPDFVRDTQPGLTHRIATSHPPAMKYIASILAILTSLFLTACFQAASAVRIKPDGSGNIDLVFSMSAETLAQMNQMQAGAPGGAANKPPTEIDEARLKERAAKLGEGVSFVSAKKLNLPGREGYVATYAFNDITKVKLTLSPDMGEQAGGAGPGKPNEEPVTFQFTKGSPAELVITTPVNKQEAGAKQAEDDKMAEQMMPMMAQMFKDMRVSMVVDVQGTIVKTNATQHAGSRVVLMDVEFGKVLADPAKFKALTKIQDPTTPEAKALLKTIPGVTVETENPVRISFK